MKIVPNTAQKMLFAIFLFSGVLIAGVYIATVHKWNELYGGFLVVVIFFEYFIFRYLYMLGRSYYYTREGCIVSFGWYKKIYLWNDLAVKKYERHINVTTSFNSDEFGDAVCFSIRPYRRIFFSPLTYLNTFRSYSSFYVVFPWETLKGKPIPRDVYSYPTADRDVFLGLLKEWGVEIEGLEQSSVTNK